MVFGKILIFVNVFYYKRFHNVIDNIEIFIVYIK